jgi:hypothetical protein
MIQTKDTVAEAIGGYIPTKDIFLFIGVCSLDVVAPKYHIFATTSPCRTAIERIRHKYV